MFDSEERIQEVNIPADQKQRIKDFLQGSVYCWCKNRKNEQFHLRDLLGGDNEDWTGTPLIVLYERHLLGSTPDEAFKQAAIDAGRLLKAVLAEDKHRKFNGHADYTRAYEWVP